jgi:hypothetical protein
MIIIWQRITDGAIALAALVLSRCRYSPPFQARMTTPRTPTTLPWQVSGDGDFLGCSGCTISLGLLETSALHASLEGLVGAPCPGRASRCVRGFRVGRALSSKRPRRLVSGTLFLNTHFVWHRCCNPTSQAAKHVRLPRRGPASVYSQPSSNHRFS